MTTPASIGQQMRTLSRWNRRTVRSWVGGSKIIGYNCLQTLRGYVRRWRWDKVPELPKGWARQWSSYQTLFQLSAEQAQGQQWPVVFFFVFQICFNLLSFYSGVQKGAQDVFGRHSSSNVPRGGTPFSYLIFVVCQLDYIQFSNLLGGTTRSLQDQVFQEGWWQLHLSRRQHSHQVNI